MAVKQLTLDFGEVEYRPVVGWPGYSVGDDGTVWTRRRANSDLREHWRQMKTPLDSHGYYHVAFRMAGKQTTYRIHTLVLNAFVGPRPAGYECRHLDGNRTNNRLTNICWGTGAENKNDRSKHGTQTRGAKLTPDLVREARQRYDAGERLVDIAATYPVTATCLSLAIKGKTHAHVI